jgi:hypothetical protein
MDEINSGWNVCDDGDELFKFHNNRNFQISWITVKNSVKTCPWQSKFIVWIVFPLCQNLRYPVIAIFSLSHLLAPRCI